MDVTQICLLRNKIKDAFHDVKQPKADRKETIGCCDDHLESFEWYKNHDSSDFCSLIKKSKTDFGLDPFEFGSLRPDFFLYFTSGYLYAVLDEFENVGNTAVKKDWVFDWTINYCCVKEFRESFISKTLFLFTDEQRQVVREVLTFLYEAVLEVEAGDEGHWNLSESLAEIWKEA